MTTSLYHVSYVEGGSLLGPSSTKYLRVEATSPSAALRAAEAKVANPEAGEWRVQRVHVAPSDRTPPIELLFAA